MPEPASQDFQVLATLPEIDDFIKKVQSKLIDFEKLKSLTKELSFNELLDTYPKLLKGEFFGRAIVNPNK